MGWKTIDLDAPGGYEKYDKLMKTRSVKKTFDEEENPFESLPEREQKSSFVRIEETKPVVKRHGVVTGVDQLRVRKQPEGEILYLISKDSTVKILADNDGWLKVETAPGREGFVMKQFIKVYSEGG